MVSVFIPTLGRSPVLATLLATLEADDAVEEIMVGDNGADQAPAAGGKVAVLDLRTVPFYAMWNQAITAAARRTDTRLAILNDDIALPLGAVGRLAVALDEHDLTVVCPDYHRTGGTGVELVTGTYRQGGICGFAFLVDAARCPLIDTRFRLWFGDDDLMWKVAKAGGRMGILRGVPVDHLHSQTVATVPWAADAWAEDAALWASLGRC